MAQYKNMFPVDLSGKNTPVLLRQMIAQANSSANKIGVIVKDGQEDVTLGGSCTGRVIRADGVTVLLDGTIEGNKAYIILDGNSYAVPGQIEICINWVNGDNVTTLLKAYGIVEQTQTESVIPSGSVINIDTIIEMIQAFTDGQYFKTDSTIITGDGTASAIADHDNVEPNTLYRIQLTTKTSWLPSDYPEDGDIYYLIDITHNFFPDAGITEVILNSKLKPCWVRMKQPAGSFGSWMEIASRTFSTNDTIITGDGTASAIANHDNVQANMLYRLQLTTKTSWLPSDYNANGSVHYLIDITHPFGANTGILEVIYDEFYHLKYVRSQQPGGSFGNWYKQRDGRTVIEVEPGTDTIQAALELAYFLENTDVILKSGNHVITNFSGTGMLVGKNMRVLGMPDSLIKAENAGTNQYFSVFYCGEGDYELNGVNITCKNIRYCIHDDPTSSLAPNPGHHIFKNCSFYIDNTGNTGWTNHQCIGGGLGHHMIIEVENCYFSAADPDYNLGLLSYHNNEAANAVSLIVVKDSEFAGTDGTVRFGWYGSSTKITKCYVFNCKMGHAPVIRAETEQSTNENMELIEWNNVVGSDTRTVSYADTTHTLVAGRDFLNVGATTGKTLINAYLVGWDSDGLFIKGFVDNGGGYSIFFNKTLSSDKSITLRRVYVNP